jgi:hypothetical protein
MRPDAPFAGRRMIRQIGSHLKKCIVLAGILALLAVSIWLFRKPELPLSDALFWVGAVPVMLGTIGGFGGYMGRGDLSVQLSKTTLNQSATDRAIHEHNSLEFWHASAWHWLVAGFILCVASAFFP